MADIVASVYVNDITKVPKNSIKIEVDHTVEKLTGDLIIKGFHDLEKIKLTEHGLTSLTIEDCPKLIDVNISDNVELKKVDFEKTVTSGDGKNIIKIVKISGDQRGFEELNFKNCFNLEELIVNDLGEVKKVKGMEDFDVSVKTINMDGSSGLSLTNTGELKELKDVKKTTDQITGGGTLPMKDDPDHPGQKVVDVDRFKNDLIKKSSEDPSSPIKSELDAIKTQLGLEDSATKQQIIDEIKKLQDIGSSSVNKGTLVSSFEKNFKDLRITGDDAGKKLAAAASAREVLSVFRKEIDNQFGELQGKLINAKYLNIALGTLSAGILAILIWMVLKNRKLLPGQEDEEADGKI